MQYKFFKYSDYAKEQLRNNPAPPPKRPKIIATEVIEPCPMSILNTPLNKSNILKELKKD